MIVTQNYVLWEKSVTVGNLLLSLQSSEHSLQCVNNIKYFCRMQTKPII